MDRTAVVPPWRCVTLFPQLEEIGPLDLAKALDGAEPPLLLDVRTDEERAFAAIEPSLHIGLDELVERVAREVPRTADVVVYCHTGRRSAQVTMWLAANGWQRVRNLAGGIDEWSRQVDPSIPRY